MRPTPCSWSPLSTTAPCLRHSRTPSTGCPARSAPAPSTGKPTAVVGTAFGQFGGVWAQDEARKAVGIAGAQVLEDVKLAVPGSMVRFAETHPKDDAEVVEQIKGIFSALAAAEKAEAAA